MLERNYMKERDKWKAACIGAAAKGVTGMAVLALMPAFFAVGLMGYGALACVKTGETVARAARKIKY